MTCRRRLNAFVNQRHQTQSYLLERPSRSVIWWKKCHTFTNFWPRELTQKTFLTFIRATRHFSLKMLYRFHQLLISCFQIEFRVKLCFFSIFFFVQTQGYWLNDTHWVDYDPTELDPSPSKRKRKEEPRPHKSGSARTEGYYKLDSKEKAKHKSHFARCVTEDSRLAESNVVRLFLK